MSCCGSVGVGGKVSLTSTEARELSNSRRCRSIREDPLPINPVIPAAGGSDTVIVDFVDYVARWAGYDAEECIQKAVEDDMAELYYRNPYGERGLDMYRLTAKGRRESDRHAREVFRKSAEAAKKMAAGDMETELAATAAAAVWAATATLHRKHGIDEAFETRRILDTVVEQRACSAKTHTIKSNIARYCVASGPAGEGNHRKLHRVRRGVYRLYRPGDPYTPGKGGGPAAPGRADLPAKYEHLLKWYAEVYCKARPPRS